MSDKQLIEMIAQGHAQRIAQDRQQQQIMAAYDQWKQQQQIMAEFDAWKASQPQVQPAQSVQEIPSIKTAQPQRDLQAEAREYFANVRKERREQAAEAKRLKEQQLTATLNDYAKQQQEENELVSISANKRKEPKVGQRPEPIDFSSPVAARGLDESTIKGGEKWKQSVNDTLNVLNSKEMKDINRYQKLVNANEEKAAKEAKKEMSNINNGINQLDLSQYNLPSESGFTEQEQKAFDDYTKALKWSDPNYRMTKEEQQEARRIASEGKQALAEKYPVENKADFGKLYERMSPEDQAKYRTYDDLSLKSDPLSGASVGAANKAVNMLGGALNTLAFFHPGAIPAARDYQKLQKKWNEAKEITGTEEILKSATPLSENIPILNGITPYDVGQAATQIGAYALTNSAFDEAGAALLGDKLGKVGGFIGNQIGQNAQDIALDTIPRYQELKAQGKSDEEIRDTLIQEGIWNGVGNLTLGALGEIPGLWKSAKNSSAAKKAADEAFRQNIREGADKLARLAGTEDVDNVVRNATRQYEEAAQNIENIAKQQDDGIRVYRGFNRSDNPLEKNLAGEKSVYDALGKNDPNAPDMLPLNFYTESIDDATQYANADKAFYESLGEAARRDAAARATENGIDFNELSEANRNALIKQYQDEAYRNLTGRNPNFSGSHVDEIAINPKKVLDISDLDEKVSVDDLYNRLSELTGVDKNTIDNRLMLSNVADENGMVSQYQILRNTGKTAGDFTGTRFVDFMLDHGYDAIKHKESGVNHYVTLNNAADTLKIPQFLSDATIENDILPYANALAEQVQSTGASRRFEKAYEDLWDYIYARRNELEPKWRDLSKIENELRSSAPNGVDVDSFINRINEVISPYRERKISDIASSITDSKNVARGDFSIQEVNRKGGKKGYYVSEELPEGGSRNVETGKVYKTREEAEKALEEYRNVSESAKAPEVNSAQIDLKALKKEANNMKTSFREKAKYLGDTDNPYARKFLESVDEFTKDPSVDTYEMMVSAHNDYMANYNRDIWKPSKTGYYHPEYHSEQIVKRLDDIAEKYGFKNGPQNDDLIKNSLDNVNTSVYDEGVKNVDANNGGIDYGTDISKGYDGTAGEGILRTDSTERPLGGRVSADGVSGGKYLPSDRVSVSDNVTKYSKVFDDADAQKLTESKIPYNDYYDVQEPELFSKSLETAKANNPHGGAVDSHTPEEIQEILNNGGKTFLTADGTAGGAVDNGNLTAVFKDNLNNDTPRAASSIAIAGVKNGAIKGDCFGKFLVNSYSKAGFEPVARMKYVYGFNERMDKQVKEQLAQGLIKSEPDVYVLKLKDGYDYQKAIDGYKTAKIWKQQELDSLPLYDDYDEMLKYRDSLIKMDLQTFAEKQPGTGAFSNGVNPDDVMKERGTSRHIRNDGTPMKMEGVSDEVVADFKDDPDMYKVLRNSDTIAKAEKVFNESADPLVDFRDMVRKHDPAALPLGHQLAKDYSAAGNHDAAAQIYREMGEQLTKAGQFSQAAAINMMKNDPLTALAYFERELDALNKAGADKYGKKWKDFVLTDQEKALFDNINPGDTDAIKNAIDQIGQRIEKEYPSSAWEKVLEFRRVAMLFNTRTIARNTLANPPTALLRYFSDRIEGVGQWAAHLINPDFEVTQAVRGSNLKTRKLATQIYDSDKVKAMFEGGSGRISEIPKVGDYAKSKQMFKGGVVSDWINRMTDGGVEKLNEKLGKKGAKSVLELTRNSTYKALEVTDNPMVRENFISRLGSYIRAKDIKNIADVPDEAIQLAYEEAMKATYKDESFMVDAIRKFKGAIERTGNHIAPGLGDMASQALIPYVQAPGNIAARTIDYSAIGLGKGINKIIKGANSGDLKLLSKGIEEAAKGTTGTLSAILGYALYKSGILTGTYSTDKDQKAFEKQHGFREFALRYKVNGQTKYDTIDWMQPFVDTIMPGVLLAQAIENSDEYDSDILKYFGYEGTLPGKVIGVAKESAKKNVNYYFDSTPLKNLGELFKSNYSGESDIAGNLWQNTVEDFAGALVPAGLNAVAKSVDPVQRQITDPSNSFGTFVNGIGAKIPELSKKLPAKYDTWGQPMTYGNSKSEAAFAKMLYPGEHTSDKSDEIDTEISRLFDTTSNKAVFPIVAPNKVGDKKLNAKEVSSYQEDVGKRNRALVEGFVNSDVYKDLEDKNKAETISKLYGASKAITERDLFGKEVADNSEYKTAIKAYDDAGGGEEGIKAMTDYYTARSVSGAAGVSANSNAAKDIQKQVEEGNTEAAYEMSEQLKLLPSLGLDSPAANGAYTKAYGVYGEGYSAEEFAKTFKAIDKDGNLSLKKKDEIIPYMNSHYRNNYDEGMKFWNAFAKTEGDTAWKLPKLENGVWK